MAEIGRQACEAQDNLGPLAGFKDQLILPDGGLYLDGNSLVPVTTPVPDRISSNTTRKWGQHLIFGWLMSAWQNTWCWATGWRG